MSADSHRGVSYHRPIRLTVFCAALDDGGAERVVITLLKHFDRQRFALELVLARRVGVWVDHVPEDVPLVDLGASRLRRSVGALARHLGASQPDILMSFSVGANSVAVLAHRLAPGRDQRRLVISERSTFTAVRRERRPRWLPVTTVGRWLYQQADRVLAVSAGVGEDLVSGLGIDRERVRLVSNPIVDDDLRRQSQERPDHPWFEEDTPIVLAVGRLVSQKDYPTLLRAFARVRSTRDARLVVLGEGADREALEALAVELGIPESVDFAGFHVNPFAYMRAASVYVLSSRLEGLPGTLIQALACGTPVVATDCPSGPAEIIEPDRNGLLVPVGDPVSLAEAVNRLLDDDALRQRLAARGPISVERYGVQAVVRRYEEAIAV